MLLLPVSPSLRAGEVGYADVTRDGRSGGMVGIVEYGNAEDFDKALRRLVSACCPAACALVQQLLSLVLWLVYQAEQSLSDTHAAR